ncbi:MAG: hypothetical protein IJX86_00495 [Lachnospiraceae bacterium]|nr:hypothetical protein [Lachnospiraceae bacterium]
MIRKKRKIIALAILVILCIGVILVCYFLGVFSKEKKQVALRTRAEISKELFHTDTLEEVESCGIKEILLESYAESFVADYRLYSLSVNVDKYLGYKAIENKEYTAYWICGREDSAYFFLMEDENWYLAEFIEYQCIDISYENEISEEKILYFRISAAASRLGCAITERTDATVSRKRYPSYYGGMRIGKENLIVFMTETATSEDYDNIYKFAGIENIEFRTVNYSYSELEEISNGLKIPGYKLEFYEEHEDDEVACSTVRKINSIAVDVDNNSVEIRLTEEYTSEELQYFYDNFGYSEVLYFVTPETM